MQLDARILAPLLVLWADGHGQWGCMLWRLFLTFRTLKCGHFFKNTSVGILLHALLPRMSRLLKRLNPELTVYRDRRFDGDEGDWERCLRQSTTVYVGNLSFYTREEQIYEVFSKVGHLEKVIMGLDKFNKTPCGFCFVIYFTRKDAENCVKYLNGTTLDERAIRVDHDWGFMEGRQWGRGRSGGQVRDEFRLDYDPGRGGYGKVVPKEDEFSPLPQQGDSKRQRFQGQGQQQRHRQDDEDNPRFRGRHSDDEGDR